MVDRRDGDCDLPPDHDTAREEPQVTMGTGASERGNDRLRRFYDKSAADYDLWMRHYDR